MYTIYLRCSQVIFDRVTLQRKLGYWVTAAVHAVNHTLSWIVCHYQHLSNPQLTLKGINESTYSIDNIRNLELVLTIAQVASLCFIK